MGQTVCLLRRGEGRHRNEAPIYLHITIPEFMACAWHKREKCSC